jgi:tetraacyldisaccharide 4'-kinase
MPRRRTWGQRAADLLLDHWFRPVPSAMAQTLRPLSWLYDVLRRLDAGHQQHLPMVPIRVPVIVVGNLIVGGAGKTPTVIAIVQLLQARGFHPGVISRGYGGRASNMQAVQAGSAAADVGDEPLLIQRRTAAPCWVGRERVRVAAALLEAHPEVDVLVSDDGLQHLALRRDIEVVVFDERGIGNGLMLPAGPLREPMPKAVSAGRLVLYNAVAPSTDLPGHRAVRHLTSVQRLADWQAQRPGTTNDLAALRGRPLLAVAGVAAPERFFTGLESVGLQITRCALPDHDDFSALPWTPESPDVIVTEKDAVKLGPAADGEVRVWVARLDLELAPAFVRQLLQLLGHGDRT